MAFGITFVNDFGDVPDPDYGPTYRAIDVFFKFAIRHMSSAWIKSYTPGTGQVVIEHMFNDLYPESTTWPDYFKEDFECDKKP